MKYEVTAGSDKFLIEIEDDGSLAIDGIAARYDFKCARDPNSYSLILDNHSHDLRLTDEDDAIAVLVEGDKILVSVMDERARRLANVRKQLGQSDGDVLVKAPMPGIIIDALVSVGDEVDLEQTLVILESMKMHNEFKAPRRAVVKDVRVKKGDKVQRNETLVILG